MIMGKVEEIHIAPQRSNTVQQVDQANLEAGKGIVGDRYHEMARMLMSQNKSIPDNHVTLIAREELDVFLANHQSELKYRDFRRNIVTSGIDLNQLVGKNFKVGEALCHGMELCEPCAMLARTVHSAVLPELVHKAGLRATILSDGNVKVGNPISE